MNASAAGCSAHLFVHRECGTTCAVFSTSPDMRPLGKSLRTLVLFAGLLTSALAAHAGDKGYFGFAMSVDAESFSFNPVLKSVTVEKVAPGSPAESAGLVKGDQFIEVEGRAVAGSKANDLKPHLSKDVGETVNLKVKKASGEIVSIALTAARKP